MPGARRLLPDLQCLVLEDLPPEGIPDGLVPQQQLQQQQLTRLEMHFSGAVFETWEQFGHLSSLTALRQLSPAAANLRTGDVPNIQNLSQLTSLKLRSPCLQFTSGRWAKSLPALQSLTLDGRRVEPQALAAFTQLRALSLHRINVTCQGHDPDMAGVYDGFEAAVRPLSLLTQLDVEVGTQRPEPLSAVQAAAAAQAVVKPAAQLKGLKQLRLAGLPGLADPLLLLLTHLTALEDIDLSERVGNTIKLHNTVSQDPRT
jgi:hypothetical protein